MMLLALLLAATPWSSVKPAERTDALTQLQTLAIDQRMSKVSEGFLGTPYVLSPLGEGAGRDADPLIRFDAVDCVTFVEEVMALALVKNDDALVPTLSRIRYENGVVGWNTRNHITEAQWVPNNVKAGFLKEVTQTLAPGKTVVAEKVLTDAQWNEKDGKALEVSPEHQAHGTFALNIVPATEVMNAVKTAPSGLVIVVVRADRPKGITRVSHTGLLIQTPAGPVLRHASRSFKKVTDEPLAKYIKRNRDFGEWTIAGLAFFEVTAPTSP